MRVGYVLDRFPRASHRFVLQEILELESRGIDVHIFSLGMPDGHIDDTAVALARLRGPVRYFLADFDTPAAAESPSTGIWATFAANSIASGVMGSGLTSRLAHWIASQITDRSIEHLHAHGARVPADVAREAGRLTGLGYSLTAHAGDLHDGADLPSLRERIAEARFVVTLSDFDRGRLIRMCGPERTDKFHRIPMGIDPNECRFFEPERHDSNSVLAIGPLIEKSGFTDLIEAIGILRDRGRAARLTIVGEGEFEEALRARIERCLLTTRVQVLGGISRSDLTTLMRTHTAMVLPWAADDCDRDVLANAVLEAMAAGVVVVSTDLPGVRELIDDGMNGRVINPRDPLWLAGALDTLFDCPELCQRMAWRARTKVEKRFVAAQNVSHLANLFFDAVARKRLAT
jgi:glycosyltransferase involved in cell wall biosynthesis